MSTNQSITVTQPKAVAPIIGFKNDLERMKGDIAAMLPSQIPVERFIRTTITAVSLDPELLKADKKSLIMSCMSAAKDGLLLDKKEAALVIFNTKEKIKEGNYEKEVWVKKVQYMPMVQGLIKKARQSGEIASLSAQVVYAKDKFSVIKGDNERIEHEPYLDGDPGEIKFAYSIIKLKDGTIQREIMTKADLDKVKSCSKAGSGESAPWVKWYSEQCRKSVLRRNLKYVPTSTELNQVIEHDNETYDFDGSFIDVSEGIPEQPKIATNPLDTFAGSKDEKEATAGDAADRSDKLRDYLSDIADAPTLEGVEFKFNQASKIFVADADALAQLMIVKQEREKALKIPPLPEGEKVPAFLGKNKEQAA